VSRALCALVGALAAAGTHPLAALDTTLLWRVGGDSVVFSESVKESPAGFLATITTDAGEIDSLPWYQFQEISFEELSAAKAADGAFWTINRASLKPSLFKAERREAAVIDVMG
jgi:hypothetical protein